MKRTPENLKKYVHFVGQTCRKENQLPLTTGLWAVWWNMVPGWRETRKS